MAPTQDMLNVLVVRAKKVIEIEGAYNLYMMSFMVAWEKLRYAIKRGGDVSKEYAALEQELKKKEERIAELVSLKQKYPDPFKL